MLASFAARLCSWVPALDKLAVAHNPCNANPLLGTAVGRAPTAHFMREAVGQVSILLNNPKTRIVRNVLLAAVPVYMAFRLRLLDRFTGAYWQEKRCQKLQLKWLSVLQRRINSNSVPKEVRDLLMAECEQVKKSILQIGASCLHSKNTSTYFKAFDKYIDLQRKISKHPEVPKYVPLEKIGGIVPVELKNFHECLDILISKKQQVRCEVKLLSKQPLPLSNSPDLPKEERERLSRAASDVVMALGDTEVKLFRSDMKAWPECLRIINEKIAVYDKLVDSLLI